MERFHTQTRTMTVLSVGRGSAPWTTFLPKDTAVAVYAATFDIDFAAPYTSNYYAFGKSLSDKVSPYSIAYLLKDFVIKDIHIEAYDRRRKHYPSSG